MTDAHYDHALAMFDQGRHAEGVHALAQAAQAGHVSSMSLLGAQLLAGRGVAVDTLSGIRLILDAAERGGAFACATAANLCAWAPYIDRPDWRRALDYLQRSAELGYQPARDQLRLLSGYRAGIDWKKLRRAVDIPALLKFPKPAPLSDDPLVHAVPGLLSPELCDVLIAAARPRLAPAMIYDELRGGEAPAQGRRLTSAKFGVTDTDLVIMAVNERLCALAGLPPSNAEGLQVMHYKVGDFFAPHFDAWDTEFPGHAATLAQQGQRAVTVLVYLNDDLEGGETDFPRLGIRHRGKKGDGLMFRNVDAEGGRDTRLLHAGLPPTAGEKWLLSLWIRDRAPNACGDPGVLAAMEGR
jgi:hypothetical protein